MKFIAIALLLAPIKALAVDCEQHPIYCQIKENNPKLDDSFAMKLSNAIYKSTKRHNLRPIVYTAILAQESLYDVKAVNCTKGFREAYPGEVNIQVYPYYREGKVCTDFGISQIHWKTVKSYQFDTKRLVTDVEYAVEAGARVLGDMKKRYYPDEDDYWTRYNSSKKTRRDIYKLLVERFM